LEKIKINLLYFIILLTLIIHINCLNNKFVNLDDPYYLNHEYIRNFSWSTVKNIINPLSNMDRGNYYQPLVFITYSLDYSIWKLNYCGYHMTNLVIFIITLLPLYLVTIKLFKNKYISLVTLLLFAAHPVHIELVAWISGRPLLLAGLFIFTSLYFFIISSEHILYMVISIFSLILAIISHPVSCLFPLIILLLYSFPDFFKGKTLLYKSICFMPYFLTVMIFEITLFSLHAQGNREEMITGYTNIITSIKVLGKYAEIICWPEKLSAIYPAKIETSFILSLCLFIFLVFSLVYSCIKERKLFFSLAWFVIFYIPVSNLFFIIHPDVPVADRYLYIPSYGIFLGFAIVTVRLWEGNKKIYKIILSTCLIIIIGTCSLLSYGRCGVWKNSLTLWNDSLKKYPDLYKAYNGRGLYYIDSEEYDMAISDFNSALSINPYYGEAYYNRGKLYKIKGEYNKAINDFTHAINIYEDRDIYIERGIAFDKIGNYDKAIEDFTYILASNPLAIDVYNYRGTIYNKKGEYNKAIEDFTSALKINSSYAVLYNNRAFSYFMKKEYKKAWGDINKLTEKGYKPDPSFLKSLEKASGIRNEI